MIVRNKGDAQDPEFHTHVSMVNPKGKFQMNIGAYESFWDAYCNYAQSGASGVGLAEKSQQFLPVLVDVDIKLPDTFASFPVYSRAQVSRVAAAFMEALKEITCVEPRELVCFVLEKPQYFITVNSATYVKNGFHLHFPYVFLDKNDHQAYLVPLVLAKIKEADVFANLGIEDSSALIDKNYCTAPWLMYGSHKDGGTPYKLSYILDAALHETTLERALASYTVFDSNENPISIAGNETLYLPRVLSIIPFHRKIHTVKNNLVSPVRSTMKRVNRVNQTLSDTEVIKNLEKARELLPLVSPSRADNHTDWMNVGWVLYNIGQGCGDALDMWIDFSRHCPEKFSEAVCVSEWEKMTVRNMSIATLMFFAKNDNPKLFREKILSPDKMIQIADTHSDIAKQLYELYGHEFVCASIKDNAWYRFENHHWKETEGPIELRKYISDVIVKIVDDQIGDYSFKMMNETHTHIKKMYATAIESLKKLVKDLKSHPFKANIIKECADLFYDSKFMSKLDSNRYLFGFQNGVYDLRECVLRDGIPEDYISTQSPLNYTSYSMTDTRVMEVFDCLEKTFPDKEVLHFFMNTTSEVFVGGNDRKHVLFWSGRGNNGKSVIQYFIERILGPYAIKFPTSLITGKRTQSSSCSPELARAGNGVRWAVIQEPDETEYVNIGTLKELSGNDTFYARALYKTGREITPMFKLLVVCNKQPKLPHIDQATINRLCVIPFESTFSDNAPDTREEQMQKKVFPKCGNFIRDKVPELIEAFLWVLLEHYKVNRFRDTVIPSKVKIATNEYIERSDSYRQFMEELMMDSPAGRVTVADVYSQFKDWLKMSIPGTPLPSRLDVQDYFDTVWGANKKGTWYGHQFKTNSGDVDDDMPV
jgi:P4 family phage/plasmid primase-like protien